MKTKFNLFVIYFLFISSVRSQSLYFPPVSGGNWDTLSSSNLNWCQSKIDSLYQFLDSNNTKSFILLKDGKIVLEKYFGTHTQNSLWYWASAGKTITAFMTGIAQQEGFLSINDTSSHYLGSGWTTCTPSQENKITVRNQLTMTSGLDDGVADLDCTTDTCLIYKSDAGTRWAYHNAPYTLLDSVIRVATGVTLNSYTTQKLKIPTGMNGQFVKSGYNNVFYSDSRSMARFGLLTLNKGNWNGNQLMTDTSYFFDMTHTSQNLNNAYGYLWWLNGANSYMVPGLQTVFPGMLYPNAPADMVTGVGTNAQCLIVVPSLNIVWIRMGNAPVGGMVPFVLIDKIWQYINAMNCNSVGIKENKIVEDAIIFPNPSKSEIFIQSKNKINYVEIYDLKGTVKKYTENLMEGNKIMLHDYQPGIYILKVTSETTTLIKRIQIIK